MTEHELQCLLVAEREWRITELEFCKKIPFLYTYPSFRSHYPLFWKFCIPMIYSHWEGFCVASMKLLVDYLNEISLSYQDAANHVLLLDNRKRFSYLQGNCSTDQQSRFLNEFLASQKTGVHIDRSVVSANSNLNFKQLSKMLSYFEISVSPVLGQQKPTIEKLVWYRNSIAHGENSITYDSSILCRMIGTIVSIFQGAKVEYIICGDGAIAISRKNTSFTSNDLLLIYNDFLCKLLIGGIYVEAIDNKDIDIGNLHGKNMLWPVGFGESASSNMHARVRMKLANNMETILLDGASNTAKSIDDLSQVFRKGNEMISQIKNLSTFYLIFGVTEMMHKNWSAAVSNLWIVTEQIIDFLWLNFFLTDKQRDPEIPSRIKSLQQDNRTYSTSVKQEILYQTGIISKEIYSNLYSVRKARNKLVHEGKMVSEEDATDLYNATNKLLQIATGQLGSEILPKVFPSKILRKVRR